MPPVSSSWSSAVHALLTPPSSTKTQTLNAPRHPSGDIWKRVLGECVYVDLAGNKMLGKKRFARLETMGLSGLLMYEIPAGRDDGHDDMNEHDYEQEQNLDGMTLASVFGDPDMNDGDASALGMEINELLDGIDVQLVYFPGYACTSFVVRAFLFSSFQFDPMSNAVRQILNRLMPLRRHE